MSGSRRGSWWQGLLMPLVFPLSVLYWLMGESFRRSKL
jgi:hypothetical protein